MFLRSVLIGAAALPVTAGAALAHHPMGGQTPSTFGEGLLSGIGHPLLGFDHLAFVIAVGLIAAMLPARRAALMPLAYVAAMAAGLLLHVGGVILPAAEWVIMLSVITLGALVARGQRLSPVWMAGLFAFAGLFHGFAFAEAIIGAEPTPVVAYVIGLAGTQYAIALVAFALARAAVGRGETTPAGVRIAGGVLAGVGLTFLLESLEGLAFSDIPAETAALALSLIG